MKDGFVKAAAATPDIRVADVAYNTENICKMIDETVANRGKSHCISGVVCDGIYL